MLKAWFKGCLVGILALKNFFSCFKRLKWPFYGPVVVVFVARFVKCLWNVQSML